MSLPPYYTHLRPFKSLFLTGRPILMYHHVGKRPSGARLKGLYVSPNLFNQQLAELKAAGFSTPPFAQVTCQKQTSTWEIYLTFDDGFCDVVENALPVLQEYGYRAMMFLVAGLLGQTNEWQQLQGDVTQQLVDVVQVREWLAAGNEIGSHTLTHPHLTHLSTSEAREEIKASKKKLEDIFGYPVDHFCYPYGDWNERVRDLVAEAGYTTACTTDFGVNDAQVHPLVLKRVTARYRSRSLKELKRWFATQWNALFSRI